jgi:hypothetical protein
VIARPQRRSMEVRLTRRWREVDSNPRSPSRDCRRSERFAQRSGRSTDVFRRDREFDVSALQRGVRRSFLKGVRCRGMRSKGRAVVWGRQSGSAGLFLTLATGAPRRCPGSESASGGRSSSYPNTAEANKPTASQSAAHSPNDRNNTAVIDTIRPMIGGAFFDRHQFLRDPVRVCLVEQRRYRRRISPRSKRRRVLGPWC